MCSDHATVHARSMLNALILDIHAECRFVMCERGVCVSWMHALYGAELKYAGEIRYRSADIDGDPDPDSDSDGTALCTLSVLRSIDIVICDVGGLIMAF